MDKVTPIRKDEPMDNEKKKDPNGWIKGLAALAGLSVIVILTIAGIRWALSVGG